MPLLVLGLFYFYYILLFLIVFINDAIYTVFVVRITYFFLQRKTTEKLNNCCRVYTLGCRFDPGQ